MVSKFIRKLFRRLKRWLKNRNFILAALTFTLFIGIFTYNGYMQNRRLTVNPTTYAQLLQLIGKVESRGNYNAYFGNAANSSLKFTEMSVAEVMQWQADYVSRGNPSNAVGKYQIIGPTLAGLVDKLNIDTSQPFDQVMQDKMAIALIERRGAEAYINGELSQEQFAANLAKEWASFPRVVGEKSGDSYYAGDGLNKSLVSVGEVLKAIEPISHDAS